MNTLKISAVVCTYNRRNYLLKAIKSLQKQTLQRNEYEILIVDNGSTDGTAKAVDDLRKNDPHLRYVFEPIIGLSQARNTAWRESAGKYVAYLDDDAIAAPDWLEKFLMVFFKTSTANGCTGGKIVPLWEAPRPIWLPEKLLYYLGQLDLSDHLVKVEGPSWLGGGNSAYPREVLKNLGGFDTRMGRKGKNLLSMEDTQFQKKLVSAGFEVYYHPGILIEHAAPASRLTQKWFKKRAFWEGVSGAYATEYTGIIGRIKVLFWTSVVIFLKPKRIFALLAPTRNADLFFEKCMAWNKLGYLYGNWVLCLKSRYTV